MSNIKVKLGLIEELLEACRKTHPNEFFAFLGHDNTGKERKDYDFWSFEENFDYKYEKVVDHYIIVPLFYQVRNAVSYRSDLLPLGFSIAGTIHSHPSYSGRPSKEDLLSFEKRGFLHIIAAFPYQLNSIYFYDSRGRKIDVEYVD